MDLVAPRAFSICLADGLFAHPGPNRYFAAYEVTKKFLTPAGASPADLNLSAVILAGGTAGVAMWAIAIPPDVRRPYLSSLCVGYVLTRSRYHRS